MYEGAFWVFQGIFGFLVVGMVTWTAINWIRDWRKGRRGDEKEDVSSRD